MAEADRKVTVRDLLEVTIGSMRAGVHPVMKAHGEQMATSYEHALGVRVPRKIDDVPQAWRPLFMLFASTLSSAAALETPLSGILEGGLLVAKLDAAGAVGARVTSLLEAIGKGTNAIREQHVDVLVGLLEIFHGGPLKEIRLADVLATGLYPGSTPKDFDLFEHL